MVSVGRFGRAKSGRTIFIIDNSCRQRLNGVGAKFVPMPGMKAYGNGGIIPFILYLDNNNFL
jgi:hypothetical protein